MSWLETGTWDAYSKEDDLELYHKFDNPEYGELWDERYGQLFRDEGVEEPRFLNFLGGAHTAIAGDEGAFSRYFWEPEFWDGTNSLSAEGIGSSLYKQKQEIDELGAAIWGDEEDRRAARDDRMAAEQGYKETVTDSIDRMGDPYWADWGKLVGGTLAEELPFLIGTAGAGTVAKHAGMAGLRYGAKRAGKDLAEEAVQQAGLKYGKRTAIGGMVGVHAARSGGGVHARALDTYAERKFPLLKEQNPDLNDDQLWDIAYEDSRNEALVPAIAGGALTGGLVALFGLKGDAALANIMMGNATTKSTVGGILKSALAHSQFEGAEETADALGQGLIEMATYNPDKTWGQLVTDMTTAWGLGTVMGGTYTSVGSIPGYVQSKVHLRTVASEIKEAGSKRRNKVVSDMATALANSERGKTLTEEEIWAEAEAAADKMADLLEEGVADSEKTFRVVQDEELEAEPSSAAEDFDEFGVYQGTARPGQQHGPAPETEQERLERYTAEELEQSMEEPMPVNDQTEGMEPREYALLVAKNRAGKRIKDERIVAEAARRKAHPLAAEFKALEEEAAEDFDESGVSRGTEGVAPETTDVPLYTPEEKANEIQRIEEQIKQLNELVAHFSKQEIKPTELTEEEIKEFPELYDALVTREVLALRLTKLREGVDAPTETDTTPVRDELVSVEEKAELEALAKVHWEKVSAKRYKDAQATRDKFAKRAKEIGYDPIDTSVNYDSELAKIWFKPAPHYQQPDAEAIERQRRTRAELAAPETTDVPPTAQPTAAPEGEAVPMPTLPSESDTHYVLSAVTGRTQTKAEGKKDIVKEKRETEVGEYKTEAEYDLGYPFILKNNEQRPAILKYTIQKKIAVGYYQGTSTSGNPIFHTIFELDPKAAGVEVFTNEKGKVTGVHVPKELASQLNILKAEASKTDTNWKITNTRKAKLASRTVDESVTSDEKTDEVIDAVTNSALKKLLKKLAVGNLVSAASIRALINTANVKGKDGKKVRYYTLLAGPVYRYYTILAGPVYRYYTLLAGPMYRYYTLLAGPVYRYYTLLAGPVYRYYTLLAGPWGGSRIGPRGPRPPPPPALNTIIFC